MKREEWICVFEQEVADGAANPSLDQFPGEGPFEIDLDQLLLECSEPQGLTPEASLSGNSTDQRRTR